MTSGIDHPPSLQRHHRRSRRLVLLAGFGLGLLVQREELAALGGRIAKAEAHDPPLAPVTAPGSRCQLVGFSL